MINDIVDLLKEDKRLYWFSIRKVVLNSYQLFFIKHDMEMNREVETTTYKVVLYTKVEDDKKMGSISFILDASLNLKEIQEIINEQIECAKYVTKKMFAFPKKRSLKPIMKDVNFDSHTLKEAAFIVADSVFEADIYENGYINSTEVFINFERVEYYDANENEFLYSKQYGGIENVVTWVSKKDEIELYKYIDFTELDETMIKKEIDSQLVEASNRSKAIPTPAISNTKLMLKNQYLVTFFDFLVNKVSTDALFANRSNFKIHQNIQQGATGDRITIKLLPTMPGSTYGYPFDEQGMILKETLIYDKGIVNAFFGSIDKACYLHKTPVGRLENAIVYNGSLNEVDDDYVEIEALSDFSVDPVTGDFCSEIRLAYYHIGKEKKIITKGSISGNVFESLKTIKMSTEAKQINNYVAPKFILIDNIKYLGGN